MEETPVRGDETVTVTPQTIRIVRRGETTSETAQTSGVTRYAAIAEGTVGSQRLWVGHTVAPSGLVSGVHHHGDSESAVYVLRGRVTFFTGDGLRERIDAGPGDFLFVPPNCLHVEANFGGDEAEFIVARSTQEAIVVNRDDIPAPNDLIAEARAGR
jgi:uncharacterized RmlC-like cupin family protein